MTENNNSRSSLADIILVISKNILLIFGLTFLVTVLVIVYANYNYEPEYTSESKIFIPTSNSNSSELHRLANQFGFGASAYGNLDISSSLLYPEIMISETFAKRILTREFYSEKFERKLPLLNILTFGIDTPRVDVDTLLLKTTGVIRSFIKIEQPMPFLLLKVTTFDARLSQDLLFAIIEELDKLQRSFKNRSAIEKIDYINQQIELTKFELEDIEERLRIFRENNRKTDSSPSLQLEEARIQRSLEIQQNIYITLKQQLELARIEVVQETSYAQVLDPPSYPLKPSNPKSTAVYVVGGILGLALSIFIALVKEYFVNINSHELSKLRQAKMALKFRTKKQDITGE